MIQRIQTIFLSLCAIIYILFFFVPLKQVVVDGVPIALTTLSGFNSTFSYTTSFSVVSSFILIGLLASITTIFLYRQRYLQIRLCYIIMVLALISILLLNFTNSVNAHSSGEVLFMPATILLAASVLSAFLAIVFIKKDINLLKRADRIR